VTEEAEIPEEDPHSEEAKAVVSTEEEDHQEVALSQPLLKARL